MKKYIGFLVLMIVLMGCKSLSTNVEINKRPIPNNYGNFTDTANTGKIKFRDFFQDSLLVALIDTALANNIDLQIALQRIEMARSDVKLSNGELLPKVSIGINAGVRKFGLYTMDGAGNISTEITPGKIVPIHLPDYYVGLLMSWEIDIWGKLRNQRKSAIARYLGSIEGTRFVMTGLISEVATNYYQLIALDNELDIVRNNIQAQTDALEIIKIQKEAGRATELAVQQFTAQLLNTQTLELEVMQRIFETENTINFLCGRFYQPITRDKGSLYKDPPANISVGIPADLLSNRPDVREAEYMVVATKCDLKAAKAAFFPNININASFGLQAFNPEFFFNPASIAYSVLGGIVAPVLNFNAIKSHFNYAKANQTEALYNYQKSILNGYVEVYNGITNLNTLEKQVDLKTQEVDVLNQSIQTSIDLFTTGRASYLEVLFAQQYTLNAQLELVQVRQEQQNNVIQIYKSLGGGWK